MTCRRSLLDRYLTWRIRRALRNHQQLGNVTDDDWYGPGNALPQQDGRRSRTKTPHGDSDLSPTVLRFLTTRIGVTPTSRPTLTVRFAVIGSHDIDDAPRNVDVDLADVAELRGILEADRRRYGDPEGAITSVLAQIDRALADLGQAEP